MLEPKIRGPHWDTLDIWWSLANLLIASTLHTLLICTVPETICSCCGTRQLIITDKFGATKLQSPRTHSRRVAAHGMVWFLGSNHCDQRHGSDSIIIYLCSDL